MYNVAPYLLHQCCMQRLLSAVTAARQLACPILQLLQAGCLRCPQHLAIAAAAAALQALIHSQVSWQAWQVVVGGTAGILAQGAVAQKGQQVPLWP
jgi:hypothetical protein